MAGHIVFDYNKYLQRVIEELDQTIVVEHFIFCKNICLFYFSIYIFLVEHLQLLVYFLLSMSNVIQMAQTFVCNICRIYDPKLQNLLGSKSALDLVL